MSLNRIHGPYTLLGYRIYTIRGIYGPNYTARLVLKDAYFGVVVWEGNRGWKGPRLRQLLYKLTVDGRKPA